MKCPKCGEDMLPSYDICPFCDLPRKFFVSWSDDTYIIDIFLLLDYARLVRDINYDRMYELLYHLIYQNCYTTHILNKPYHIMRLRSRHNQKYLQSLLSILEEDFGIYNLKSKLIYICKTYV